jgi:predicted nucleotidyltransferase
MQLSGIHFDEHRIAELCRAAGVTRAWVFGSVVKGTLGPSGDIDILVETDAADPAGLLALGGLQMNLSDLLGRPVHLTLLGGVPPLHRATVLANARLVNAA